MQDYRTTETGSIDYAFYKNEAARLRNEVRFHVFRRSVSLLVGIILSPVLGLKTFAKSWQSTWPSPDLQKFRNFLR